MPSIDVRGFVLQDRPSISVMAIPGKWLLAHSTPSWRIENPIKGFQRVVKEERAKEIAWTVLDEARTFPNAVVLATNSRSVADGDGHFTLPNSAKFLVVDGQHRIWAQNFSEFEAMYACVVHFGLTEVEMARLFLEINDNQKRVPSSLRWDLVRLVRPNDDPYAIAAAEMVYSLATDKNSPLFQRIDLTGEQGEKDLKQGSLAPEFKTLLNNKKVGIRQLNFEDAYELILRYLDALRAADADGWRSGESPFLGARVMRASLRLLPEIIEVERAQSNPLEIQPQKLRQYIKRVPLESLDMERIRALQGTAGIKHISDAMRERLFR